MTDLLPYSMYVVALVLGVYIIPGLALVPRAAFDSKLAYAVPIISALTVTSLGRAAKFLDLFTQEFVLAATLVLAVVACYRLWRLRRIPRHWPMMHRLAYLMSISLVLIAAADFGLSFFRANDVAVSWNRWAIQHTQGQRVDPTYAWWSTYPQTHSYLIAWCYQLLGSTRLQAPVLGGFAMLGISLVAAIGTAGVRTGIGYLLAFIGLAVVLLFVGGERGYTSALYDAARWPESMSDGFAEVLMVPAIVVSIALYLQHLRSPESLIYIWLASAAAIVVGLTKQLGLIWLMLAFPILVALDSRRRGRWNAMYPVVIGWLIGLLWLMTEGFRFWGHDDVIRHSFGYGERTGWFEQLLYSVDRYLVNVPTRVVLIALSIFAVWRHRRGLAIYPILLVPYIFVWFLYAAYTPRHGLHIGAIAVLLIVANDFGWGRRGARARQGFAVPNRVQRYLIYVLALAFVIRAGYLARGNLDEMGPEHSLLDGKKNYIYRHLGDGSEYTYQEIFRTEAQIGTFSFPGYALFYSENPVFYLQHDFFLSDAKARIDQEKPFYIIDETKFIKHLMESCPDKMDAVVVAAVEWDYSVYRMHDALSFLEECIPGSD